MLAEFFLLGAMSGVIVREVLHFDVLNISDLMLLSRDVFLYKLLPFFLIVSLSTLIINAKNKFDSSYIITLNSSLALGYISFDLYYFQMPDYPFWLVYYILCFLWIYMIWAGLITQGIYYLKQGLSRKALLHLSLFTLMMAVFYVILYQEDELSQPVRMIYLTAYPFIHIQIGASLINNALSNSPNFQKNSCLRSSSLSNTMAILVSTLLLITGLFIYMSYGIAGILIYVLLIFAPIFYFYVLINRMTSFFLVKDREESIWNFAPFFQTNYEKLSPGAGRSLTLKGLSFDESLYTEKMMEWVSVYPQNPADSFLEEETELRITDKFYVDDVSIVFPVEFKSLPKQLDPGKYYCIVPKLFGTRKFKRLHIMALFELSRPITEDGILESKPLHVEWIYWGVKIRKQRFWENFWYFLKNDTIPVQREEGQSMAKT